MLALDITCHQEDGATQCDGSSVQIVLHAILLSHDECSPNHDWDHFGTFTECLKRERDVLEGFVLAEGGNDIGDGDRCIGMWRGDWADVLLVGEE